MAKKNKQGGVSIGLILVLIFFVITTFVGGTLAYLTYSEQENFKKQVADAKKEVKTKDTQYREERARKIVLRMSYGIATPEDSFTLIQEMNNFKPQVTEEYENILRDLNGKTPVPFEWTMWTPKGEAEIQAALGRDPDALKNDPDNKLGARPTKTVAQMAMELNAKYAVDVKKGKMLDELAKDIAALQDTLKKAQSSEKEVFVAKVAELNKKIDDRFAQLTGDFNKLAATQNNNGKVAADRIASLGKDVNDRTDELGKKNDQIKDLLAKLEKYESIERRTDAVSVDLLVKEDRKGKIVSKDEAGFVTLDIGSNRKLKPQVRFLVISANVSWLTLEEKEASLRNAAYTNDRQPYEDNPYVKASVEVAEILGPQRSRAKILFQNDPIRNPVQVDDQVFNVAWNPQEGIRVAFAGIIDLDGDGIDNNREFMATLERNGVILDEFLSLNPLDFVKRGGRGMNLQTKYLIIAENPKLDSSRFDPNSPQRKYVEAVFGKLSDIKQRARSLGVQMVDARKFVALMGYKLPRAPAPLQYDSSIYWNNPGVLGPPMAEPPKN